MSKLEALVAQHTKALDTLEDVLTRTPAMDEESIYRDSAIQHFEFCFDLSWKLIKEMLREKHGIECASPKGCLKEAFAQNIITDENMWLTILEMRSLASHTYNEELALKIFSELPLALAEFKKLT